MKLEEIQELWSKDSDINERELDKEALNIPALHSKYYKIYSAESLTLFKLETELKQLKFEKYEFFTQGHTKETVEKGWKLPAKGVIIKSEVGMYIDADPEIIKLTLKIALQKEKVTFLDSIIKSLTNRGFNIKSAIEFIKFRSGG